MNTIMSFVFGNFRFDIKLFYLTIVSQGFSVGWWKEKHCTHHAVPNVHEHDPDIDTMPFLAWSEHDFIALDKKTSPWTYWIITNQAWLFIPFLAFARISWAYSSFSWVFFKTNSFPTNMAAEKIGLIIHYLFFFSVPFYLHGFTGAVFWPFVGQIWCGLFLAAVFSLNHVRGTLIHYFSRMDFKFILRKRQKRWIFIHYRL